MNPDDRDAAGNCPVQRSTNCVERQGYRFARSSARLELTIIIVFAVIFLLRGLWHISDESVTLDEFWYIPSGYSYLKDFDYRMNYEHPPVGKIISGIPLLFLKPNAPAIDIVEHQGDDVYAAQMLYGLNEDTDSIVLWARIPFIILGVLLGCYVYRFSRDLYGMPAGVLSLTLYTFSPSIIGHSRLAAIDFPMACFSLIAVYYFWRFWSEGEELAKWLSGVFLGLGLATKHTAVFLVPAFICIAILSSWMKRKKDDTDTRGSLSSFGQASKDGWRLLVVFTVAVMVVILAYGVIHIDQYIKAWRFQIDHNAVGHMAFLRGEHSMAGWVYYFPYAFLIKTPLAIVLILILTVLGYRRTNNGFAAGWIRDQYLLLPVFTLFGIAAMGNINTGLRNILPVLPLLAVFAGQIVLARWEMKYKRMALGILVSWLVLSSIQISPHYLSYFNELIGGPDNGYKHLIDSNIDWGQDIKRFARYAAGVQPRKVKACLFGPDQERYSHLFDGLECGKPVTGLVAASVHLLMGGGYPDKAHQCFEWLLDHDPIDKIGYSILIYDI